MLKAALLAYRRVNFDLHLTKVAFENGCLNLCRRPDPPKMLGVYGPFSMGIVADDKFREAALANNQCTTAMALASRLSRKLLEGSSHSIDESRQEKDADMRRSRRHHHRAAEPHHWGALVPHKARSWTKISGDTAYGVEGGHSLQQRKVDHRYCRLPVRIFRNTRAVRQVRPREGLQTPQ